jgi:hypothetical protein
MVDSAWLGAVVDEGTAVASELVVEGDRGGEAAEAGEDAFSEPGEGAGAVAFEGEEVFAGPEDRLDPLSDRREVRPLTGLVFAARPDDRGAQLVDFGGELAAGVVLVAEQHFAAVAAAALEQQQADLAVVDLRGSELERPWGAVGGEDRVQPESPEEPRMRGAVAVVGGVSERGALGGFAAAGALAALPQSADRHMIERWKVQVGPYLGGRQWKKCTARSVRSRRRRRSTHSSIRTMKKAPTRLARSAARYGVFETRLWAAANAAFRSRVLGRPRGAVAQRSSDH